MIDKPPRTTNLNTEITYLKGVGPNRAIKLKKSGIEVIDDLLYHFPRRYIDRTKILKINRLQIGQKGMLVGEICSMDIKQAKRRRFFELGIKDETGLIKCIWFRGISWISEKFEMGESIAIFGKIEYYNGFRLIHPEFDLLDDNEDPVNTGKIISIYPSNSELKSVGIDSRGFRRLLNTAIDISKSSIEDFYDDSVNFNKSKLTPKMKNYFRHNPHKTPGTIKAELQEMNNCPVLVIDTNQDFDNPTSMAKIVEQLKKFIKDNFRVTLSQ